MIRNLRRWLPVMAVVVLLAGCAKDSVSDTAAVHPTGGTQVAVTTATPPPTATSKPSPTATPTRPPTMTPLPTDTPLPTPTPPHPLDIEKLRHQAYPGSELVFEETLEPGSNYDRYIVSYQSEGLKIYAFLTIPRGEVPATGWPVVIFNHGYIPPAEYRSTERYVAYVDAFARRGYIVLRSDYRGHGNSEGDASGSRTPDYTIDVLSAVGSIKRYEDADPARIGMWGHSMGGGITLSCMVVTDDIIAGVIWAGVVAPYPELITRYLRTPTPAGPDVTPRPRWRWPAEMLEQYGSPDENPSFWAAISASTYVGDLSGPIQLQHGTADQSVPLEYSLMLEQQIVAAGKPVELYTYEGDDHNIAKNWGTAMNRSVEFMDRHVK